MLDRWRLAIVLALLGFLASAALIAHTVMGNYSELEVRWGVAVDVICPGHLLISALVPNANQGTSFMAMLWLGQTAANAAIYFAVGAFVTKLLGGAK